MKKIRYLLMSGMGAVSIPAFAQSVTLYGLVDTGIEYVSHANAAGGKVIRMPAVTGELPSRWGLRGSEDLGDGYKAVFTLENGFNLRGGDLAQGGRLFGRQAWVGISGPYGTVSFGRQYSMTYLALLETDVLGPAIYSLASLDAYIPNARSDNTIAYKGTFSGFTVGATYSFGRDSAGTGNSPGQGTCAGSVPGKFTECRQWSAMLKYDAPMFSVVASYDEQRGGASAAANFFDGIAPTPLTSNAGKDVRMQLNGYVKVLGGRIAGGWLGRRVETASTTAPDVRSDIYYLSAAYPVSPFLTVDGGVYRIINRDHDTRATLGTLRGSYFLSKRTAVYMQAAYLANSARARYSVSSGGGGTTPAAGVGQTGVMLGMQQKF